ncbi:MAG: ATP-dependent RecD-like DNA helicase, partial [Erysipelothrix sp.]|nr:ATP-dependent RecD-like DNA helicase [Erysipelothrix sp.]
MNNHDKITGFFERVIFYNESNFYTVASFITNSLSLDEMIVVGHIKDLDYDQEYVLYGDFIEHSTYGLQFKIAMVEKMAPSGEDSLVRFLSSPLFPSIGKKSAGLIYDAFGDDLIAMIKANPSILDEVKL